MLPFENATGSAELNYAGDDLAEGLIDSLSSTPKLRVVPRNKAFRFRDETDDLQHVGRELGVRAILTGRITLRGDVLSVRAELIDIAKDSQLWGAQVSRPSNDLLEIQEEIAKQVRDKLQGPSSAGSKSSKSVKAAPKPAPAINKEAYQLYVRATHHCNKWTQEGIQLAIDLCRQAIDIDPVYAAPYATMALGYTVLTVFGPADSENAFRQGKAYAQKALQLDDTLAEAHAALGFMALTDFNLAEAIREGKRAIELNPKLGMAYYVYAQAMGCAGDLAEAVARAREGCDADPLMAPVNYCYGLMLYYAHRWDDAEKQLRRTLEINPDFGLAQRMRAIVLTRGGRFEEGMAECRKFLEKLPNDVWELLLAYVAALGGDRELAQEVLARHAGDDHPAASFFFATIYGVFRDFDRGFAALERARDMRFLVLSSAAVNPALEPFRGDPRWPAFLKSMNFGVEVPLS